MVKHGIQIYARIKPTKAKTGPFETYEDDQNCPCVAFTVPRDVADGYINNKKEVYRFRFNKVFDQHCKQDVVFEEVAKDVIDNVISGYNGTIFAYGQTGSGKTFTITGGAEKYSDRGLIPRALSYIFEHFEQNSEAVHTAHISYLEIYNEYGYDLLDPKHEASKLEDLPKVTLLEDGDSNVHLKNLSLHQASNEEEALNLLFIGDTNRMIAETPMNQASTRSHCIFTVHLTSREPGSATIRRAKLHLVDLAGSERVGKTNVGGTLLTEAKYINLSLHFLEQVIVALSEKSRTHIPYRNSMMTSVLRDSLGGNCMTCMIATCSVDKKNLDESISTCRFAQRVALIKNDVSLNEEVDPKLMIERLRREIQKLKDELAMATGEQRAGALTPDEMERLQSMVKAYIEDSDPEAELSVGADMRKIDCCFHLLKGHVLEARTHRSTPQSRTSVIDGSVDSSYLGDQTEVSKLKDLVKQRDNEINILVGMLKKEKKRASDAEEATRQGGRGLPRGSINPTASDDSENELANHRPFSRTRGRERPPVQTSESREHSRAPSESPSEERPSTAYKRRIDEMSAGRKEAFDTFRRDYAHNSTIEENKVTLKQRYAEAKGLGEQVNSSRQKINSLKTQIEQHRVRRSMQGFVNGVDEPSDVDPQEQKLRQAIESEKSRYKESFTRLRSLKTEIEHLQHLLEKSKVKMQKDFEIWWAEQAALTAKPPDDVRAAWRTPPISPVRPARENSRPPSSSRRRGDWGGPSAIDEESLQNKAARSGKLASRLRVEAQLASSGLSDSQTSQADSFEANRGSSQSSRGFEQVTRESSYDRMSGTANDTAHSGRTNGPPDASHSGMQLTGDSRADADILAFIRARQNVLQRKGRR